MTINIELTGLTKDLSNYAENSGPIRIGLVGCGEMGTDIVTQVLHMPGIEIGIIYTSKPSTALNAIKIAYQEDGHGKEITKKSELNATIEKDMIAVTQDSSILLSNELIDVVVDATGIPEVSATVGIAAMKSGKHLVMMNVEADVTVGSYLRSEAERLGVVYSLGAGDEPSSCMELIEFVSSMGHRIISAGKGKNNPFNINATPDLYMKEAKKRNMNPRMLVEFIDGSKTMVEMAAIANATGLKPDKPGMHGPSCSLDDLNSVLVPKEMGGLLSSNEGFVDYTTGKNTGPSIFVIAEMQHPRIRERMEDLKLGKGPYYTFIRPYHLTSLEVPLTCAKTVLYKKADMAPMKRPVAEVCALAKKNLNPGETLDKIGEYSYRAWIMNVNEAKDFKAIPCGLLLGSKVTKPIKKGELITYLNTSVSSDSGIVKLRKKQDNLLNSFKD